MTKLVPLANRLLVKPIPEEENKTSKGGIIIPVTVKEQVARGTAISVGSECNHIKVGDTVLYSVSAGTEITIENEKYLLMFENPHEIYAII